MGGRQAKEGDKYALDNLYGFVSTLAFGHVDVLYAGRTHSPVARGRARGDGHSPHSRTQSDSGSLGDFVKNKWEANF